MKKLRDPSSNCALMCDNTNNATDIFMARDNGSAVFTIANGGAITATSTISASQYNVSGTQITTAACSDVVSATAWTPTITGFSSNPTLVCMYTKIGKMVTIQISNAAVGTSNATTMTITNLPFASNSTASFTQVGLCTVRDNSTWQTTSGNWTITSGSSTIQFGVNANGSPGGFTASGTKGVSALIIYFTD